MNRLCPSQLDDVGLSSALRSYGGSFTERTGVAVAIEAAVESRHLGPEVEVALFRIAQEALLNVAKHAEATKAKITLTNNDDRICLRIADNGNGGLIAPDLHRSNCGWGLIMMRERAEGLGGRFRAGAVPGQGTEVVVEFDRKA